MILLVFCCYFVCFKRMEVWVPPGELVGEIIQEFCVNGSKFGVYNRHLQVIYRIEGTGSLLCGSQSKDTHFRVGNTRDQKMYTQIRVLWTFPLKKVVWQDTFNRTFSKFSQIFCKTT